MQYVKLIALVLVALVAFKVAFSLMGDTVGDSQRGDGLVLEPTIVNLGTVNKDQGYNFSASMRNNGQKPAKVAKIERSCGCLQAYPTKDTCQPGETVAVNGALVPNKLGRFRYVVKFIEEDPSAPEHTIEVVGDAVAGSGSTPQAGSSTP